MGVVVENPPVIGSWAVFPLTNYPHRIKRPPQVTCTAPESNYVTTVAYLKMQPKGVGKKQGKNT